MRSGRSRKRLLFYCGKKDVEYFSKHQQGPLTGELEPIIEGLGYKTVEVAAKKTGSRHHVSVIISGRDSGIGLTDCEKVHKAILPRLEILLDDRDIYVEVSSPGISRNLKCGAEFGIFVGSLVRLLLEGENEWIVGRIMESDERKVVIEMSDGKKEDYLYDTIRKAKLVDIQEAKK
ncbi:protein of unknown function DUF150 [Sediminispirochaeta smaragdinae DSM 11293]|uniref:Ribosome maturation factor RimP n=1 Tax=Sediminispirochaeta smaragdinae (strain DSM 11293 / JCM 15392 / SEBR 4228) TaxID=573413 RepID=E1R1K7_SEDSS|nr:protein of unknown function DUF150 [Sediminispirochaeta smaragdinae DSM 11293]